ncbi:ABC transporter permease [Rothia sp. CCM 9416]|uniref:ABC transporter permease n=1 Tax=Rothia sp. CCM 9416 TaxID=3402655 RepID=UPI003AE1B151
MFVGWRDILFAKGRFTLIGATVTLITLLLVMLTGLTGGLGRQNTDALQKMGADRFIFASDTAGAKASFTDSSVTTSLTQQWQEEADRVTPVGFLTAKVEGKGAAPMTLIATPQGSQLPASTAPLHEGSEAADDQIVLPLSQAHDLGAGVGDTVSVNGTELTVTGIAEDTYYSHTPAGWITTSTWQKLTHQNPTTGPDAVLGTVLAAQGASHVDATATATRTQALTTKQAFAALPAYSSEHGSLTTMQGFLYGISALVIVSFLTVWTIQRTRDIALMRALGASRAFLTRDALAQAGLILALGTLSGALAGWALGALVSGTVPFQLSPLTVVGPAAGIWALGMGGALIALRRVATVDPMLALGGN